MSPCMTVGDTLANVRAGDAFQSRKRPAPAASDDAPPAKRARVEPLAAAGEADHGRPDFSGSSATGAANAGPTPSPRMEDTSPEPDTQPRTRTRAQRHTADAPDAPDVEDGARSPRPAEDAPPKLTAPTDDLRRKCPLCFGGGRPKLRHTK